MLNIYKCIDDKTSKTARATKNVSEIWNQDGVKGNQYVCGFKSFKSTF